MDEFRVIESPADFDDAVRTAGATVRARSRSTRSGRADSGTRSAPTSSRCTGAARARSSSTRPQIPDFSRARGGDPRRGVGAPRGEPGPRLPARGRPRPRPHLRHRARGAPARDAPRRARLGRRGAARHQAREGALGGRLVDPPAAAVLAEVRRPRRGAARRRARPPRRAPRRDRQGRPRGRRSSTRCCTRRRSRPLPSRGDASPASTPCATPRNLAVARELWLARDARASELDIAPGRMVPDCVDPRRREGAPPDPARPRRPARVHRPGEPHPNSIGGGRPSSAASPPTSSRPCGCRATRRRRRGPGRCATPRPTRGCGSRGRASSRSPSRSTCPSRTCSRPTTCVGSRGHPPAEPTDGGGRIARWRRSARARGRLRQPHR